MLHLSEHVLLFPSSSVSVNKMLYLWNDKLSQIAQSVKAYRVYQNANNKSVTSLVISALRVKR